MIVADPLRADIPDSLVALDALLAQAHAHADRGDLREAVEAAERALAIARAEQDAERVARAYSILGQARRASADYPRSLAASQEALEWLERAGVDRGRGQCVLLIGQVYLDLGDYAKALEYIDRARTYVGDPPDPYLLSQCLHCDATVQAQLADYDAAARGYEEALDLRRASGDEAGVAKTLNSLGALYLRIAHPPAPVGGDTRTHFEAALARFVEARKLAERVGDRRQVMLIDGNIAAALGGLGRVDEALARFVTQLDAARGIGDRQSEALILRNLGESYRMLGDYDRSLASLSESLAIATEVGAKTRARNAHEELAKTCEAMGDMGRALTHFKAFHALDREVHGVETRRAAQAHLMKVEIERVQREAEFHRRQNADLSLANEKLAREARQDELTGLANRREFDRALAVAFDAAVAGDRSLAIVLFDVDHFKRTNDRHTHVVGDAVLQEIAATLTAACRATDGSFRYGGEEFVLLLRDAGRIEAVTIAERVRGAVAARDWNGLSTGLLVTMSAGVAAGTRFASAAEMLRTADEQLYRAKRNGRNRVCAA